MNIIECAKECGAKPGITYTHEGPECHVDFTEAQLTAFADRVRAEERERCALKCDAIWKKHWNDYKGRYLGPHPMPLLQGSPYVEGMSDGAEQCAAAIRGGE